MLYSCGEPGGRAERLLLIMQPVAETFTNFPAPLDPAVYAEAVARYIAAVSSRSSAIYQVGNVRYPGLSDIDLIVVVNRAAWDNNQFFSPFVRLSSPYRALFHHEPRFVPESCLDSIVYGSCVHASSSSLPANESTRAVFGSGRRLLFGSDLLGARTVDVSSQSWQRCRVLEVAYITHLSLRDLVSNSVVDVVKLMSRATALRYSMRLLHDLLGVSWDREYERSIDEARGSLLRAGASMDERTGVARGVYARFTSAVHRYEMNVRTLFDIGRGEDLLAAVADLLSGVRRGVGIESAFLAARHAAAMRFQDAQRRYRLSGGSIFATKPMHGAGRHYVQPFAHRLASSARWRLSYGRS